MQTNIGFYKDNIFYLILALLAFSLNSLSYSPFLLSMGEYSPIRNIFSIVAFSLFLLMIVFKMTVFFRNLTTIRIIPIYIFSVIISILFMFMFFDRLFPEFYYLAMPILPFIAGTCLTFYEYQIRKMFFVYSIFTAIIAVYLIVSSGMSFEVSSTYLLTTKNSICVIWGICAVGLFYFALSTRIKLFNILELILSVCFCIFVLMGQGRAAMVATAFIGILIFLKSFKNLDTSKIIIIMFSGLIFALAFILLLSQFSAIGDYIYESFLSGRDSSDLDSLSSGRLGVYKAALSSFFNSPISGTLSGSFLVELPWVHNYPLRMLYEFGLLFGFPFLFVYTTLFCILIKAYLKKNVQMPPNYSNLGYYLLGFLFIISMFEPLYPFAPGTVTAIGFFFFGMALSAERNSKNVSRQMPIMQNPMIMPRRF